MLKTRHLIIKLLFIFLFFQTTCLAVEKASDIEEYLIKPEDKLTISVWKHPDLGQDINVDKDGFIVFPLIGKIEAEGLTVNQLKDKITYLLGKDYIVDPLVTITTEKQNFFIYVYGEVKSPGSHILQGQITLLKAITLAGGLSDFASSIVYIKRKVKDREQRIKVDINHIIKQEVDDIPLKADDIVVVPRRFF
jgi:polysaccharide export outer membrane protein